MTRIGRDELAALIGMSPMISFLGIYPSDVDADAMTATFSMPMRLEFERLDGSGQYHGGAILAFADTAGDFAVACIVGGMVPTMNFRMDFLRPAKGGALSAAAKIRKIGRTVAVVDVDVFDTTGKLVAIGRGSYGASPA